MEADLYIGVVSYYSWDVKQNNTRARNSNNNNLKCVLNLDIIYFTATEIQIIRTYQRSLPLVQMHSFLRSDCKQKPRCPEKTHLCDIVTSYHLTCRRWDRTRSNLVGGQGAKHWASWTANVATWVTSWSFQLSHWGMKGSSFGCRLKEMVVYCTRLQFLKHVHQPKLLLVKSTPDITMISEWWKLKPVQLGFSAEWRMECFVKTRNIHVVLHDSHIDDDKYVFINNR